MHFIVGGIEAVTGGGLILGPLLGSPLYNMFGYRITFCIAGGALCLMAGVFAIFFPMPATAVAVEEIILEDNYVSAD